MLLLFAILIHAICCCCAMVDAVAMLLLMSTNRTLQYFPKFQLRVALAKSTVAYHTSPSKRPCRYSISPDRRSKSPSPTPKHHGSPHKRLRSRSPPCRGRRQRDASSRKTGNYEEGSFFPSSTGSCPSGVCVVCLGRSDHNFSTCNSSKLWDGKKGWAQKNEQGRLATPEGLVLCFDWQLPKSCTSTTHSEKYICTDCGESNHGAQKCPCAEKA